MASGIALGPVPEFEGHLLESLHARSRCWGRAGTGALCLSLFIGAGALGGAALSSRPLAERMRTVAISLSEEPPPFPSGGRAATLQEQEAPLSQPEALAGDPASEPESRTFPLAVVPRAAEVLPAVSPENPGHETGDTTHRNGTGYGPGSTGTGPGTGGLLQGRGPGTGPGEGFQRGIDPGALYRSSLASWLAARKRYPVAARNQGRQGEVLLALEIDPQGVLTLVRLERSSGHDLLDQAALSLVRSCGTLPPPPPGLRQIRVSVDYSLA